MNVRRMMRGTIAVALMWATLAGAATAEAPNGANTSTTGSTASTPDEVMFDSGGTGRQGGGVIGLPSRSYRRATCKMRFDRLNDFDRFRSIEACDNAVSLSRRATKLSVPSSWATWSRPPFAESRRPSVAVFPRDNIRFSFDEPVRIAGFEVEPNTFAAARVTVRFFNSGGRMLRTIRMDVDGNSGARLFAYEAPRASIAQMSVQVEDNAGFAIAQLRVASR